MRLPCASLAIAGALVLLAPASAHDSWISHRALRPAAGEWCCGDGDCGIIDRGAVHATPAGYRIDGFMTIFGTAAGDVRVELHETVPYSQAQPSPDGEFWRCKRTDGTRRCFFAPPPSD